MTAPQQPEFAILGAGAIGAIIGAHLARGGHSVAMLARGRRAEQLRSDGFRISGLAQIAVPATVIDDPSSLRGAGVFIVATKTPGTRDALKAYSHARFDAVFSIQNGLLKDELLVETFGAERALGALADTSGELAPSGEVLFTRNVSLIIGELSGGESTRAQTIARTIDRTGLRSEAVPDVLSLEWSKFVSWAPLIVLSVATRAETWRFLEDKDTAWLFVKILREMAALARGAGAALSDRAMIPVTTLLGMTDQDAVGLVQKSGAAYRASAPHHRLSALQDVEAGRALEVDETIGYAVRKARELKMAMPLTEAFYELVAATGRISASARQSLLSAGKNQ